MKTGMYRLILAGILALGIAVSATANAGDGGKGCKNTGTWFGVNNLEEKTPTGWMVTATGQSADHGVTVFEYKTFNGALLGLPAEHDSSAHRGVWKRLNGNTFAYSFMAIAVGDTHEPLYLARVSGEAKLSSDCMSEEITALLEIFWPGNSPFDGVADLSFELPPHFGYRYTLD